MFELKHLYQGFRDPKTIATLAHDIAQTAKNVKGAINIMEV
ncbi:MAG: hydrogenase formation protein HypD, partial [Shewanella sp.]